MRTWRENPDGEENTRSTKKIDREIFALKMQAKVASEENEDYSEEFPACCTCGGDGMIEYMEGGPETWGEDCPSEENHLVTCPNCRGSGLLRDCTTF